MRTLTGKVISDKMEKTVVVDVVRSMTHPLYHKRIRRTKKYLADNEKGAKTGDIVKIKETRPVSKLKVFEVVEVIKHAAT
ncbi:30S ribosomal protein S17 [Candidatus Amesbacteria bacterium]|nr:30S ribosomal protein S17 [Candidatus Amesbacteria bacterium]